MVLQEMAVPSSVRARLQISMLIEPDVDIDLVENSSRIFFPLIWFEISAEINKELGWWLNLTLYMPIIGTSSLFAMFCLSLLFVAVSGIILIRRKSRSDIMNVTQVTKM